MRDKNVTSPKLRQAAYELERNAICKQILSSASRELYLHLPYLDMALASLSQEQNGQTDTFGTDGFSLQYHPDFLIRMYKRGAIAVNRGLLHSVLHCLLGHLDKTEGRNPALWDLACDIVVEQILDNMPLRCLRMPPDAEKKNWYFRLQKEYPVLTAERVYRFLTAQKMNERTVQQLVHAFRVDDHRFWYTDDSKRKSPQRQKKWDDMRERMQTEMEIFGNEADEGDKGLREAVRVRNRRRYDYRSFLKKFSVLKEEVQVDPDSFDTIFYTYGMQMYGNMPLIEPNETREVKRIEDFVIVIDTSMSCKGELVRYFLEETYDILMQEESFFRKINLHILQCDEKVQEDVVIHSREEMDRYMEGFTIVGSGGTDFRPAFGYVNTLLAEGVFTHLRGLLYFTDGYGTFPMKKPLYDTAFIFWDEHYRDLDVPPWAIRLVLTQEDLEKAVTEKNEAK